MKAKWRAVIIGDSARGEFGHYLDQTFARVPSVEVVAVADPVEEGRQNGMSRSNAPRGYADYRAMLQKEQPKLAVIAPAYCDQRHVMVQACVEAGVRGIYLEKPVAATPAQADVMVETCHRAGVRAVVNHWRASGEMRRAKELIAAGEIGSIQMMRGHGKADARAGGVDFMVLGTHILDAMLCLANAPVAWVHGHVLQDGRDVTRADAFEGPAGIGRTAGNALTAEFAFGDGVIGIYDSFAPAPESGLPAGTSHFGLEVHGTRGILSIRQRRLSRYPRALWVPGDEYGRWERVPLGEWEQMDGATYYSWCHEVCITELVRSIEGSRPPRTVSTLADSRVVTEMIMAAHESHLAGRRIEFPLANRGNPYHP